MAEFESHAGIEAKLSESRRRLAGTDARNRLIHVLRGAARGKFVDIIHERSDDVYRILRVENKKMRFLATGQDAPAGAGEETLPDLPVEPIDDSRYTDTFLETPLGPQTLEKKLLQLESEARTAEEETGLFVLFLAMGFLSWLEKDTNIRRESPLVLLPVSFERDRKSAIFIRRRDEDLAANLPLQERLKNDFGIRLPDIEDTENFRPSAYFAQVAECIQGRLGWSIDENGMQLGFFSFDKLRMIKDLDPGNWPNRELLQKEKFVALLAGGFSPAVTPGMQESPGTPESLPRFDALVQILDADASQTRVIEAVRAGHDLVVQGPPGTGKSQTIANIIAAAVHDGKTVLFVAEKMAALSVVHERLVKCGLADICMELHSHKTSKKAFWDSIKKAYAGASLFMARETADDGGPKSPQEAADALNEAVKLLHELPGHDYTPYDVMADLGSHLARNTPQMEEENASLAALSRESLEALLVDVRRYAELLQSAGPPWDHPFFGTRRLDLHTPDLPRLKMQLEAAARAVQTCLQPAKHLAEKLARPEPSDFSGMETLCRTASRLAALPREFSSCLVPLFEKRRNDPFLDALTNAAAWKAARAERENFAEDAPDGNARHLKTPISKGVHSWWSRWFGGYRKACAELQEQYRGNWPREPNERLKILNTLLELQKKRQAFLEAQNLLAPVLGDDWAGEETDFELLQNVLKQMQDLHAESETIGAFGRLDPDDFARQTAHFHEKLDAAVKQFQAIADFLQLDPRDWNAENWVQLDIRDCAARLERMAAEISRYPEWVEMKTLREKLQPADAVCTALERGSLAALQAADALEMQVAEARWKECQRLRPELNRLFGADRQAWVRRFAELEHAARTRAPETVLRRWREQLPLGSMGEMGFIRSEMEKSRRLCSIRTAMERAGNMLLRIQPVFMMSPLSVARFLPPGAVTFDVLVIDEASQVRPEEALGAVARARQLVVVGDDRQLPPTDFFQKKLEGDGNGPEEDSASDIGDMESILSLCRARGIPAKTLLWHYRSRTPALICVSNQKFYEDRLILPPSPWRRTPELGLFLRRVDGVYTGSGNRIEAQEIVKAVLDHAHQQHSLSLGVVAFSEKQRDLIQLELERVRRSDPALQDFLLQETTEPFFVKNLENVQGDERDVIFISVGYGPETPGGRLSSMNFGPVNKAGGERRINVLFTRARRRCEVFASFDPADIDTRRTSGDGPRILRDFLEFAQKPQENQVSANSVPLDKLETDVGDFIRKLGYECDERVGNAAFQIAWAVRHPRNPDAYMLAVACDGECYRRSAWVRERDRLMREVLESMGWRVHRVWSTDWFNDPARAQQALRHALEAAAALDPVLPAPPARTKPAAGAKPPESPAVAPPPADGAKNPPAAENLPGPSVPAYRRFEPAAIHPGEPHEFARLPELVHEIVKTEGPVHEDIIARRVAAAFDRNRTGNRIQQAVRQALGQARQTCGLVAHGPFWMTPGQEQTPPVRRRSRDDDTAAAEWLCPLEIRAADTLAQKHNGEMPPEERVRCVLNLLGFARTGELLENAVRSALNLPARS